MRFDKSIYKNELFFASITHTSAPFTRDIYMTFHLLTWTYFNDVNGGRNILINATRKNETELRKTEKRGKRKWQQWKWDFSENEIPDLNSLKPFEFEPKTNIRDINHSSSDDEEEDAEHKVKQISNSVWCECIAKAVVGRFSSK